MFDKTQDNYKSLRLIYAERTNQIVFWTGAGLSQPAGIPNWAGLRTALETAGEDKAAQLDPPEGAQLRKRISDSRQIRDPWVAFERLEKLLGETTYNNTIRNNLSAREGVDINTYKLLWRLRIGGILNLNLDRLATRAFTDVRGTEAVHEFAGHEVGQKLHLVKRSQPFIVNLHGDVDSVKSWILKKSELDELLARAVYQSFIDSVLIGRTVVFIGVSADDVAAGGFLQRLRQQGADPGQHFWITTRRDATSDKWAERNGISVIRYSMANNHAELTELLTDIAGFVSVDDIATPVIPNLEVADGALPSPTTLAAQDPETIRTTLNAHASAILKRNDASTLAEYEDFYAAYKRSIHNAWFVSTDDGENVFFGYRLLRKIGEGAFGRIYEAEDEHKHRVAIKLLRHEVMGDQTMLASFRRGVRSMRLLSEAGVEGMVPYRRAFELPACAIMDLVDGPNLELAVKTKRLNDWRDRLFVAASVVSTIRRGHSLPQRVLHRDIRPQNIMLRTDWDDASKLDVVVLDFDLSWHKDATEKSVTISVPSALGYCAPEQIQSDGRVSTRSALVDSFGLGMTFYYLFSGKHPAPGDDKRADWSLKVMKDIGNNQFSNWVSLPARAARLIVRATKSEQKQRIDASQIEQELELLKSVTLSADDVTSAELEADELLARAFGVGDYEWDSDRVIGTKQLATGVHVRMVADEVRDQVILKIGWSSAGDQERKSLSKYLPAAVDQAASTLRKGGWEELNKATEAAGFMLEMRVSTQEATGDRLNAAAKAVSSAAHSFSFQ
jgi:serine/threonine protein kinase